MDERSAAAACGGGDVLVSFAVISALCAIIFEWCQTGASAGTTAEWPVGTALLFIIGKFLIGLYLGTSSIALSFGAPARWS